MHVEQELHNLSSIMHYAAVNIYMLIMLAYIIFIVRYIHTACLIVIIDYANISNGIILAPGHLRLFTDTLTRIKNFIQEHQKLWTIAKI